MFYRPGSCYSLSWRIRAIQNRACLGAATTLWSGVGGELRVHEAVRDSVSSSSCSGNSSMVRQCRKCRQERKKERKKQKKEERKRKRNARLMLGVLRVLIHPHYALCILEASEHIKWHHTDCPLSLCGLCSLRELSPWPEQCGHRAQPIPSNHAHTHAQMHTHSHIHFFLCGSVGY